MKRKGIGIAVSGLLLVVAALGIPAARADVAVTQQARLVGEKPVSGRYVLDFTDYGPDRGVYCPPHSPTCMQQGHGVTRGKLQVKLSTYHIQDGMDRWAYYLLDVDGIITNPEGKFDLGNAIISVTNLGRAPVDHIDTKSLSADDADCDEVPVSFGAGWGVVSASTTLGSIRWCDEEASLNQSQHGLSTSWVLKGLGSTTHFQTDRAVKVRAGTHPRFRVDVLVPRDVCTRSAYGKCLDFDNRYKTATYEVGTSGR